MDTATVSNRRTYPTAVQNNGGSDRVVASSATPAPAPGAAAAGTPPAAEIPLPSHLPSSPHSAATTTGTRRHAPAGADAASIRSAGAAAASDAAAAPAEGGASSIDSPGRRETQKCRARNNNSSSHNSTTTSSISKNNRLRNTGAGGLPWRRARRLLRAFWRRRAVLALRADLQHRLSRLQRHTWGRRLVLAPAILLAAFFWFLVITTLLGPAGGGRGRGDGRNGAKGDGDGERPYYRRIVGEVAVGPSLSDPWMVREIEIAAADWGSFGDDTSPDNGGGGGGRGGDSSSSGGAMEDAMGSGPGGEGWDGGWDGRVNSVVTGELEPAGGAKTRRKVDLLLTIFSGSTEADADKRYLLRQIYDRYEGWVRVGGPNSITGGTNPERREFTVSTVFIMSKESAPPEGELVGDILYVPVPEGYRNIVLKTKAMLCLVRHFDFEYLLKADDDSFVCLARIASMLHDLDPEIRGRVYAGVPTACNQDTNPDFWNGRVMKNPAHRWFDSKYVQHTLGGLDCFPAYMQGAFYILAQPLVEHLYRGHEHLECFTNEDVTIGSWLMGVDRELVEMYNMLTSHLWDCLCARTQITTKTRRKQMFFHNCKGQSQLKLCGTRLLRPGIGC